MQTLSDLFNLNRFVRLAKSLNSLRIDLHTYDKTTDQRKALSGDAALRIADLAKASSKPIVIENLDFSKKKAELEATHKPLARMLSSFACNKVISSIKLGANRPFTVQSREANRQQYCSAGVDFQDVPC